LARANRAVMKHPKVVTPGKHAIEGKALDHIEVTMTPTHLKFRKVSSARSHKIPIEQAARHAAMMEALSPDRARRRRPNPDA